MSFTNGQMRAILFLAETHLQRLMAECFVGDGTSAIALAAKVTRDVALRMAELVVHELERLIQETKAPLDAAAEHAAQVEAFRQLIYLREDGSPLGNDVGRAEEPDKEADR